MTVLVMQRFLVVFLLFISLKMSADNSKTPPASSSFMLKDKDINDAYRMVRDTRPINLSPQSVSSTFIDDCYVLASMPQLGFGFQGGRLNNPADALSRVAPRTHTAQSSGSSLARVASQTGFESTDAKRPRTDESRMELSDTDSDRPLSLVSDDWETEDNTNPSTQV